MSEDPWKDLEPPSSTSVISARRVDATLPWSFFWARGIDRRCMLVLEHGLEANPKSRFPTLRGIEIFESEGEREESRMLAFKLLVPEHRDLFYRLCRDIVGSTEAAATEHQAVEVTLARTWRWHHLLRGGDDGRLSLEQQKGLIGELMVLRDLLLPSLSEADAVLAWQGPLGSPTDFVIGRVCIEAKARRGAAKPFVAISTPAQLDGSGLDALFLHVVELDRAPPDSGEGFSVTEVARLIRDRLVPGHPAMADLYENLLAAAGLRWDDDYSDVRWLEGASRLFVVEGEFPRIVPAVLPAGVTKVEYAISLVECSEYETDQAAVIQALWGPHHVD